MDKNRFETLKHIVSLDPSVHPIQSLFSVDDLKWLIEQAEETDDQTKWADTYFKELQEAKKEIEQKEKKTISKVLAYVEKNHDAPEIEEYLWKLLDKDSEFELTAVESKQESPRISIKPSKSGTPLTTPQKVIWNELEESLDKEFYEWTKSRKN